MRANEMAPLLTRTAGSAPILTQRQVAVRDAADREAAEIDRWQALNAYFHDEDARYLQFLIPAGLRILELGCAAGDLLAKLAPSVGIGMDISPGMIALARQRHPELAFHLGNAEDPAAIADLGPSTFDIVLLSDTIGSFE